MGALSSIVKVAVVLLAAVRGSVLSNSAAAPPRHRARLIYSETPAPENTKDWPRGVACNKSEIYKQTRAHFVIFIDVCDHFAFRYVSESWGDKPEPKSALPSRWQLYDSGSVTFETTKKTKRCKKRAKTYSTNAPQILLKIDLGGSWGGALGPSRSRAQLFYQILIDAESVLGSGLGHKIQKTSQHKTIVLWKCVSEELIGGFWEVFITILRHSFEYFREHAIFVFFNTPPT